METPKLNPGDLICSKCEGEGFIKRGIFTEACPKCLGNRKVDWIENIVGKTFVSQNEIDCKLVEIFIQQYRKKK